MDFLGVVSRMLGWSAGEEGVATDLEKLVGWCMDSKKMF